MQHDYAGADAPIPTIKIKSADTESGFVIINAHDRRPEHELYVEPKATKAINAAVIGNLK